MYLLYPPKHVCDSLKVSPEQNKPCGYATGKWILLSFDEFGEFLGSPSFSAMCSYHFHDLLYHLAVTEETTSEKTKLVNFIKKSSF